MKPMLNGFALATIIALAPQPASADLFDNDGPLCSVLSIGCAPPPPPPPPVVEPVAAPAKQARKVKTKTVKAAAEAPATATPTAAGTSSAK